MDVDRKGGLTGVSRNIAPATIDMSTCPYLLLDIRDKDEYDQCHIIPGMFFILSAPPSCLNFLSKFKNKYYVADIFNIEDSFCMKVIHFWQSVFFFSLLPLACAWCVFSSEMGRGGGVSKEGSLLRITSGIILSFSMS